MRHPTISPYLPFYISLAVTLAFQALTFINVKPPKEIGYILLTISALLFLWAALSYVGSKWPTIKRLRLRLPIYIRADKTVTTERQSPCTPEDGPPETIGIDAEDSDITVSGLTTRNIGTTFRSKRSHANLSDVNITDTRETRSKPQTKER